MKKLIPSRTKYKKYHKGVVYTQTYKNIISSRFLSGSVSLKVQEGGRISSKQIEAVRFTISKIIKKVGVLRINAFALLPISKKPVETRMGKGKGSVDHWVFCAQPGFIFCEIITRNKNLASMALKIAQGKLPLKTKVVVS
jgi:large subunit ribosomal protein L16